MSNQETTPESHNPKNITSKARVWPVREALRIFERLKEQNKTQAIFETGYSPSGLPHIGTIAEIIRTVMVKKAFDEISEKEHNGKFTSKIISFIDDMDGLRKVPTNIPNQELLQKHLHKPLTKLPDPFGEYDSFATYNTTRLKFLLKEFDFIDSIELCSATEFYTSGKFNAALLETLKHHQSILDIMLKTLGDERKSTYSPFLPISKISGKVLQVKIDEYKPRDGTIVYTDEDGKSYEVPVTDGNCKLQWKPDLGMRWHALGVDYELYGKDLISTVELSDQICKVLGSNPPVGMHYEHFLSPTGGRVSKSKGNESLTLDHWRNYTPTGCLAHFLFQNPQRAKRMRIEDLPTYVDNYIADLNSHDSLSSQAQKENALHYINTPFINIKTPLTYKLILSLACACHAPDKETLSQFIPDLDPNNPLEQSLVETAYNYYSDEIRSTQVIEKIPEELHTVCKELIQSLKSCDQSDAQALQSCFFDAGKKTDLPLGKWFQTLYQALIGTTQGPKLGTFCMMYGVKNVIQKLEDAIA